MAYNAVYTDPAHDHCFAFFAFETDEAAHIAAKELYAKAVDVDFGRATNEEFTEFVREVESRPETIGGASSMTTFASLPPIEGNLILSFTARGKRLLFEGKS